MFCDVLVLCVFFAVVSIAHVLCIDCISCAEHDVLYSACFFKSAACVGGGVLCVLCVCAFL